MYLSIQLASSGASTSTTGALRMLCCASNFTASARLVSDFISTSEQNYEPKRVTFCVELQSFSSCQLIQNTRCSSVQKHLRSLSSNTRGQFSCGGIMIIL